VDVWLRSGRMLMAASIRPIVTSRGIAEAVDSWDNSFQGLPRLKIPFGIVPGGAEKLPESGCSMRRGRAGEASIGTRRCSGLAKAANIRSAFATALSLRHDPPRKEAEAHETGCAERYSAGARTTRDRSYRRTCGSNARHCRYVVLRSPLPGVVTRSSRSSHASSVDKLSRLRVFSQKAPVNKPPFTFNHAVRAVFHWPA
jgi:hypothetical protein